MKSNLSNKEFLIGVVREFPLASLSALFLVLNLLLSMLFYNNLHSFEYLEAHPLVKLFWKYIGATKSDLPTIQIGIIIILVLIDTSKKRSKTGSLLISILIFFLIIWEIYLISLLFS